MRHWWISPLILALSFGAWKAFPQVQQWCFAPPKTPSAKAITLSESMLNHPDWRKGKNRYSCIVNEKFDIQIRPDGTVCTWKDEAFLKTFSSKEDRALIENTYPKALLAIEDRMVGKLFENPPKEAHTIDELNTLRRDASEVIGITSNECQELIPAPRDEEAIRMELDPILKSISEIKEPKRRDRAVMLYKQLLETLDISPENR